METVDRLLGPVHVGDPEFAVERLGPGPAFVPSGERWGLIAVARGRVRLLDATLAPGDAVLTRGRGDLAADGLDRDTTLLVTRFALHGTGNRMLALPDDVVVYADSEFCRLLIERLADRFCASADTDVVSERLLDWLVTCTVRDVLTAAAPAGTVTDPDVSAALSAVHEDPARPWTVEGLARHTGVSRAAFARRFREAVGTSPLSYVREHRLDVAERALITEPDLTVAAVARRVGYANPFSFSAAFRRHRGLTPSEVRHRPPSSRAGGGTLVAD